MASCATPIPTSWSRAVSAAPRVSYIAVSVRSVIDGTPFLDDRDTGLRPSSRWMSARSDLSLTGSRATSVRLCRVIRISSLRISLVVTTSCSSTTGMISTPSSSRAAGRVSTGTPRGTRSTDTSSCCSSISATSSRSSTRVRTTTRPRSTSRLPISSCSSTSSMNPDRASLVIADGRSRLALLTTDRATRRARHGAGRHRTGR